MKNTVSKFLTIAEAADRLSVDPKTIRRYISAGKLTGYRLGSHLIRLDPMQVDGLLRPMPNALTGRGDAA